MDEQMCDLSKVPQQTVVSTGLELGSWVCKYCLSYCEPSLIT
jgi:hypothetical protein